MKLLVDQNISHRILAYLLQIFPGSSHIRNEGLLNSNDYDIFMYARKNNFSAIVTLDIDFSFLLSIHGIPPKVIWLRTGNCSTKYLGELLQKKEQIISSFIKETDKECLQIF